MAKFATTSGENGRRTKGGWKRTRHRLDAYLRTMAGGIRQCLIGDQVLLGGTDARTEVLHIIKLLTRHMTLAEGRRGPVD